MRSNALATPPASGYSSLFSWLASGSAGSASAVSVHTRSSRLAESPTGLNAACTVLSATGGASAVMLPATGAGRTSTPARCPPWTATHWRRVLPGTQNHDGPALPRPLPGRQLLTGLLQGIEDHRQLWKCLLHALVHLLFELLPLGDFTGGVRFSPTTQTPTAGAQQAAACPSRLPVPAPLPMPACKLQPGVAPLQHC